MFEELEKLSKLDIRSADSEEISNLMDLVGSRIHMYDKNDLETFFDIAIKIMTFKKGIASRKAMEILSTAYRRLKTKIVSMLWSDDPHLRNAALKIIAENKDEDVLHTLIKDNDRDIRKFALDIAYEISCYDVLRQGLEDEDLNVMVSAAEYLSKLGDRSAITKIEEKIKKIPKDDIYSFLFLVQSLLNLEHHRTAEIISSNFDPNDPIIKPYYIQACGMSRDPKYLDDVLNALENDPDVRRDALNSLVMLLRETTIPQTKKENIKKIIEAVIPKMTTSELEIIKSIQNLL